MAYVVRADIEAEMDSYHLAAALDDDKDGVEDTGLFTALSGAIDAKVAAYADLISQLGYPTPPATLLRYCAQVFFCALLFSRRGIGESENPYSAKAKELHDKLDAIESGELSTRSQSPSIIATTNSSTDLFDQTYVSSLTTTTSTATTSTTVIIAAPDGTRWQLKVKLLSGQPVHYWEEVA